MAVVESHAKALAVEPLLAVDEVARQLGVATRTIYRLVADGELECVRVRGALRFEPAAVRAFVESRRQRG